MSLPRKTKKALFKFIGFKPLNEKELLRVKNIFPYDDDWKKQVINRENKPFSLSVIAIRYSLYERARIRNIFDPLFLKITNEWQEHAMQTRWNIDNFKKAPKGEIEP